MAYHFLGGLLAHAPALAAVCAPTVNSYKRLVVGRALVRRDLGAGVHRLRRQQPHGLRAHSLRPPRAAPAGWSVNPYLATAAIVAAGLDGIDRKLDPGAPNNDNLYNYSAADLKKRGISVLPQSLKESIDALEEDEVVCDALGADLAKEFIELKRMEWVEYSRHVSEWELNRYVEFF